MIRVRVSRIWLPLLLAMSLSVAVSSPLEMTTINAPLVPNMSGSSLGTSIDVHESLVYIGAPHHSYSTSLSNCGAVSFWTIDSGEWVHTNMFWSSAPVTDEIFGYSLSVNPSLVAVSALGAQTVQLFDKDGAGMLTYSHTITRPTEAACDTFGHQVSLAGDYLAVTCNHTTDALSHMTFIYQRDSPTAITWTLDATLPKPGGAGSSCGFGLTLGLRGTVPTLVVPYHTDGEGTDVAGGFTVYKKSVDDGAFVQQMAITGYTPGISTPVAQLGKSVSLDGDGLWLAVGAMEPPSTAAPTGIVLMYRFDATLSGWLYHSTLHPPIDASEGFGESIAIRNGTLVVGDPGAASGRGALHVYTVNPVTPVAWTHLTTVPNPHPTVDHDGYGRIVKTWDGVIVASNPDMNGGAGAVAGRFTAELCPAGTFQNLSTCSECPIGTYGPLPTVQGELDACLVAEAGWHVPVPGSTAPSPCHDGNYSLIGGLGSCMTTGPGFYVPADGEGHTAKLPCHNGTYQPSSGQAGCLTADPGHYVPDDALPHTDQIGCDAGTYQNLTGQVACVVAPAGYYVPPNDRTTLLVCHNGTYQPSSMSTGCIIAPPGYVVPASGRPETMAVPCGPGSFSTGRGAVCLLAEVGWVVTGEPRAIQTMCNNGKYQDKTGQTACKIAAAGHYVADDGQPHTASTPCPPGHYQPVGGQTSCIAADEGYHVSVDPAIEQTVCDNGQYQPAPGQGSCLTADPGHYVPDDALPHVTQTGCGTGTYQGGGGQAACINAEAGYYVSDDDRTARVKCLGGEYASGLTSTTCTKAGLGTFIPADGLPHTAPGSACGSGHYANETGLAACHTAEAGYFVADGDKTKQQMCGAGTYQPATGQTACVQTDPGYHTPAGTPNTAQIPCPAGTYQPAPASQSCIPATQGSIAPLRPDLTPATHQTECGPTLTTYGPGQAVCVSITAMRALPIPATWSGTGGAVLVWGTSVFVSAIEAGVGAVHRFTFTSPAEGWVLADTLTHSAATASFGHALTANSTHIVITDPDHGDGAGLAAVYRLTDNTPTRTLTGVPGDRLGAAVAAVGDILLLGCPGRAQVGHEAMGVVRCFGVTGETAINPPAAFPVDAMFGMGLAATIGMDGVRVAVTGLHTSHVAMFTVTPTLTVRGDGTHPVGQTRCPPSVASGPGSDFIIVGSTCFASSVDPTTRPILISTDDAPAPTPTPMTLPTPRPEYRVPMAASGSHLITAGTSGTQVWGDPTVDPAPLPGLPDVRLTGASVEIDGGVVALGAPAAAGGAGKVWAMHTVCPTDSVPADLGGCTACPVGTTAEAGALACDIPVEAR